MVDRARTPWKIKVGLYFVAEFGEAIVSTNDTVTFDTVSTVAGALIRAHFIRKANGGILASTNTTNVAEITTVGVIDEPCVYIVYGIKA